MIEYYRRWSYLWNRYLEGRMIFVQTFLREWNEEVRN